jgi:hypothetical protein
MIAAEENFVYNEASVNRHLRPLTQVRIQYNLLTERVIETIMRNLRVFQLREVPTVRRQSV